MIQYSNLKNEKKNELTVQVYEEKMKNGQNSKDLNKWLEYINYLYGNAKDHVGVKKVYTEAI